MKDSPNIILISLDTTRADHLSCYGYSKRTTPNIDKLAEDGAIFEQAYSTGVWTPPAHASMLTGLYPSEHGVIDQNRLDRNIPTIAEFLNANGYRTGGFINNSQVGQLVGLDKGHETFVEIWRGKSSSNIIERGVRFLGRKIVDSIGLKDHGARITNKLALKWLDEVQKDSKPFYLFLHYIEAHNPLEPPLHYKTKFIRKESKKGINKKKVKLMADNPLRFYTQSIQLNECENDLLIDLYDGEIAYMDNKVGEIVNYLKRNDLYDDTLIIITADHGEHFGEHGQYSHVSSLYQPIIHIPMIVRKPGYFEEGRIVNKKVSLLDIMPTIADLLRIESDFHNILSGISLLDFERSHDYIVSEWEGRVPYFVLRELDCDDIDPRVERFKIKMWAIQSTQYKYIRSSDDNEQIYNMQVDIHETKNLIRSEKNQAKILNNKLRNWKSNVSKKIVTKSSYEADEETRKNLESLGYI